MVNKIAKGGKCVGGCIKCEPGSVVPANKMCTYTEKYLFFDYEAQQDSGVHVPNLVIIHDFSGKKFVFNDNSEFCEWLIEERHRNYTAIAHYARGYDSHFIMQYCVANTIKPKTIYNGTKLMELRIRPLNIRIIDSHNFVPFPLAAFPKTFGLTELKKGYFPHLFNTPENENYIGPIPAKEYYCFDTMTPENRNKFIEWHDQKVNEGYVFDFAKEIAEYCDSDVDILRRGCLDLRKTFLDIANIDPFQYVTIPGVCMALFRSKYLPPETVAVDTEPHKDRYSKESIAWLESLENPNIRHALRGGEVGFCGARVDGYDATTGTVYQYHGCFWHGCPRCHKPDFVNNVRKMSMEDLYEETVERTRKLRAGGYEVVEMWGCQWKRTAACKRLMKTIEFVEPLNPRDALFGGRTEVFKLLGENTEIGYGDIVSLYPTLMFNDYYPIGHPTKIFQPTEFDENWFGFITCKVIAPKNLYLPVLPVRVKMGQAEKLVFPLCVKCAESKQALCNHSIEKRQFIGTWTTVEVKKALEKGYLITTIYEVWDFEKTKDLWKGYIADFMKIKLETSPHNYLSSEAYAADIKEKIGIEMDPASVAPNPGKRAVSKLCLNSLWGKFGQRSNMPNTEFVEDPFRFYEILLDERLIDVHVFYINDNMLQVNYKYKDTFVKNNFNTNTYIAAYTTANACLRLYEQLERMDRNVFYCDTDSIMYKKSGGVELPFGEMLGEWTDELNGDHIKKWVATGPKSYYYETNTGKMATKVKGFTLHHKNAEKINGIVMEQMVRGEIASVSVENKEITRDPESKQLVNKDKAKTLHFVFDKRIVIDNYDTLPYGYVEDGNINLDLLDLLL